MWIEAFVTVSSILHERRYTDVHESSIHDGWSTCLQSQRGF